MTSKLPADESGSIPSSPKINLQSPKIAGVLLLLWPSLLVICGYLAWQNWGAGRLSQHYGHLEVNQLHLPPLPKYIRTDVLTEVFQDAGLASISLLDQNATAQIARAFETSPWVRRVDWVRKLSTGSVEVQVSYRVPVAMIPVERSLHPEVAGPAFFAVDADSVLLPSEDFAPSETMQYLHIIIPNVYPTNRVGSPFGDPRIQAAARTAALLAPYREELGLAEIELIDPVAVEATFVLRRRDSTRIIWGSAPGAEVAQELPAEYKLQRLVSSNNALSIDGIDLRSARGVDSPRKNF